MKIKFTENKSKSLINCTCLQFQIPRVNDMMKSQGPVKMKGNVFLNYFQHCFQQYFQQFMLNTLLKNKLNNTVFPCNCFNVTLHDKTGAGTMFRWRGIQKCSNLKVIVTSCYKFNIVENYCWKYPFLKNNSCVRLEISSVTLHETCTRRFLFPCLILKFESFKLIIEINFNCFYKCTMGYEYLNNRTQGTLEHPAPDHVHVNPQEHCSHRHLFTRAPWINYQLK
jgi:hypothetical protein